MTFLTAGFPTFDATVPLMLALEAGGADIIELGVPFSDPIADGPTIQQANTVSCLIFDALDLRLTSDRYREQCPLLRLSGIHQRGASTGIEGSGVANGSVLNVSCTCRSAQTQAITTLSSRTGKTNLSQMQDKQERMVSSWSTYRPRRPSNSATSVPSMSERYTQRNDPQLTTRMSYVPLIAPATSIDRVKMLASIADSFIYVVSKMGTTGSSASTAMSSGLPELITRIRAFTPVPLAVGFGVDNRTHFDFVTSAGADGVVIGSKIIKVILEASKTNTANSAIEAYCREISLKGSDKRPLGRKNHNSDANGHPSPPLPIPAAPTEKDGLAVTAPGKLPSRFGLFGGAYVPESLVDCLNELEAEYVRARDDPEFWKEFEGMYGYMNRPSELYLAERLTEHMGGAQIWLK